MGRFYGDNGFIILTFRFIAHLNAVPDTDSCVICSKILGCINAPNTSKIIHINLIYQVFMLHEFSYKAGTMEHHVTHM